MSIRLLSAAIVKQLEEETFESELESYDGKLLSFVDGRIVPVALVSRAVEVLK